MGFMGGQESESGKNKARLAVGRERHVCSGDKGLRGTSWGGRVRKTFAVERNKDEKGWGGRVRKTFVAERNKNEKRRGE